MTQVNTIDDDNYLKSKQIEKILDDFETRFKETDCSI